MYAYLKVRFHLELGGFAIPGSTYLQGLHCLPPAALTTFVFLVLLALAVQVLSVTVGAARCVELWRFVRVRLGVAAGLVVAQALDWITYQILGKGGMVKGASH